MSQPTVAPPRAEGKGADRGQLQRAGGNQLHRVPLSVRASNCHKTANIRTIADLVQKTEPELKTILGEMGLRCV